jgi:hypothetical protein
MSRVLAKSEYVLIGTNTAEVRAFHPKVLLREIASNNHVYSKR